MDVQPSIYIKSRPLVVFDVALWLAQQTAPPSASDPHHDQAPPASSTTLIHVPAGPVQEQSSAATAAVPVQVPAAAVPAAAVPASSTTQVPAPAPAPLPAAVPAPLPKLESESVVVVNNSSGDWKAEYERAKAEEQHLQKQLEASRENVEVYRKMLAHSAASMDKWKRHEGMTELEAQQQMQSMLQHTQQLNEQLRQSQRQHEQLQQQLNTTAREKQELARVLHAKQSEQRETLAKLDTVERQLEQNRQQLARYKAVMVEKAREYVKDKSDEQVRAKAEAYRRSVEQNAKGDQLLKQLNLQAATIMELLLQQRKLTQQLQTKGQK